MKFGYQTILWGHRPSNFDRMLKVIADAGFSGVEFFQQVKYLPPISELLSLLASLGLELAGLVGGDLADRASYLGEHKEPYLYLDSDHPQIQDHIRAGYRVAIHPHYLKKIDGTDDAADLLKKYDGLLYIPDTAHSIIKRERITNGLASFANRLAAVHLQDWRPGFGRASLDYARGMTELGRGQASIIEALTFLKANLRYSGWAIVEQDCSDDVLEASVYASSRWLQEKGYLPRSAFKLTAKPQASSIPATRQTKRNHSRVFSDRPKGLLFGIRSLANRNVGQLCRRQADRLREALSVSAVGVWSCSEPEGMMTLQAFAPQFKPYSAELMSVWDVLPERIEPQWIQISANSTSASGDALQGLDGILRRLPKGLRKKVTGCFRLPVYSSWKPNVVRLVIDLFHQSTLTLDDEETWFLSRAIGSAFDAQMDRITASSAAELNLIAVRAHDLNDFCRQLRTYIQELLPCEATALFLVDDSGTRLVCRDSQPPLEWRADLVEHDRCYYEQGDGQWTTTIWQSLEPRFINFGPHTFVLPNTWKSKLPTRSDANRVLQLPIVDIKGESVGLIRCSNRLTPEGNVCNFSNDDLVVLDHVLQQAIPSIRLLRADEDQRRRLMRVSHELKRPISAIRGVIRNLDAEVSERVRRYAMPPLSQNYLRNALMWTDLLRAVVRQSDYLTGTPETTLKPVLESTLLMADIVAPAVAQIRGELRNLRLPEADIRYDDFDAIPRLYIDRNMFQQVLFNLLDNAIKYRRQGAGGFRVEILTSDEGTHFRIRFRDFGIGIPGSFQNQLFTLGRRGTNTASVLGTGIGLWLARQLLEAHGASLAVSRLSDPTEFRIDLPKQLTRPPKEGGRDQVLT